MKNRKRNLTMLAVLMFVCAAVALNWSYNNRWGTPDSEMVSAEDEAMMSANAEFADNLMNTGSEYFAEARLTRQVSRDEALELRDGVGAVGGQLTDENIAVGVKPFTDNGEHIFRRNGDGTLFVHDKNASFRIRDEKK